MLTSQEPDWKEATRRLAAMGKDAQDLEMMLHLHGLRELLDQTTPWEQVPVQHWVADFLKTVVSRGMTRELLGALGSAFPMKEVEIGIIAAALRARPEDHPAFEELRAMARVVLIVSVDLADSKLLKQGGVAVYANPWTVKFSRFYDQFPRDVRHAYQDLRRTHQDLIPHQRLDLLRVDDDDLMFTVEITSHQQVVAHLHAVASAVHLFNRRRWRGLSCKATVWVCGMPITDLEYRRDGEARPSSYVGPSMDMGYALKRWSTPVRIPMSLQVATMFCEAVAGPQGTDSDLELKFASKQAPATSNYAARYPRVWLAPRLNGERRAAELDARSSGELSIDAAELIAYLAEYREAHGIVRWFLKDDDDERYRGPTWPWLERFATIQRHREATSSLDGHFA